MGAPVEVLMGHKSGSDQVFLLELGVGLIKGDDKSVF